jgi:hypothetical protein
MGRLFKQKKTFWHSKLEIPQETSRGSFKKSEFVSAVFALMENVIFRTSQIGQLYTRINVYYHRGERKMTKSKILAATALLLMLVASLAMSMPAIHAAAPTQKTFCVVDATPNPVGVGQQTLIRFGILQALGSTEMGWTGLTVTVVHPDSTTETLGPFRTDATGGTTTVYTPAAVGTYKLTAHFPQQTNPADFFDMERGMALIAKGTVMLASDSDTINLVVQQTPLPILPGMPLPAEFWSRPVDPQLRSWYSVTGNWLTRPANDIALYNDYAPETAHVLWANPITTGGLVGGIWGEAAGHTHGSVPASMYAGDAYAGKYIGSVIMNGVLFYNRDDAYVGYNGICAVDLRTGQQLWFRNNTYLSFGQILYFNAYNVDGTFEYLWDTTGTVNGQPGWNAYNPFTGEWVYSMINVPSGTQVFGQFGEILIYVIDYAHNWLALWNSTAAGQTAPGFNTPESFGSWSRYYGGPLVHGSVINGSDPRCYSWNTTIPKGLTAGSSFFVPILQVYPDRVMSIDFNQTRVRVWAVSTAQSTRGQLLFDKTWTAPADWLSGFVTLHYVGATDQVAGGVIAVWCKELRTHYGFSTETGDFLWQTSSEIWLDAYGWGNVEHTWYFAYGNLYSVGVGGIVYAYDLKTGKTVWTYNMTDTTGYHQPVTGNNWWGWITLIADGKLYVGTLEHSAEQPVPAGGPYICLNATDGSVIWRVNGMFRATRWGGNAVMGDSIIATMDTYDQRIYAIGKGPSATTVKAPMTAITVGDTAVIEGTVTDISAGTKSDALTARFPNGVPAVSDASMSDWMLYVYKQFPAPTNATGVTVSLDAIDPNNNFVHLGTVTTDTTGNFGYAWAPPNVPGKYTILASFPGTNGYYASYAETYAFVSPTPPSPTPTPTQPLPPDTTMTIIATGIAIIIAVAIVGALMLRKRA